MRSELKLQVYEDGNESILTIIDRSVYNPDITTTCSEVLITAPGFGDELVFEVAVDFNKAFTSHDFGYTDITCDKTMLLQDGIYVITYNICPTDTFTVTYNHLRQTRVLNKYYKTLCSLQLDACQPTKKQKENLLKLKEIKQYLDAAKAYVEVCGNPKKGLELNDYAIERLSKISTLCKTC